MIYEAICAALAFLPVLGLWTAYPRRPWAAGVFAAAGLAAAAALAARAPRGLNDPLFFAAAAAALGSAAAWLLSERRRRDGEREIADLDALRESARKLAQELSELKARGGAAEREQKETLALYGMIKSLAEALSWEDAKPRLEAAVDQYLGLTGYALYAAAESGFKPVTVRRLEGSPGSTWTTLERCLQTQGLAPGQANALESPEKAVALPIVDNGQVLGYFYGRAPQGMAVAHLLGKAQTFASEIAFAFRRVALFQQVESLSKIDGLTGVHRRGGFDDRLRQETVRAKTFKTTLGLMILDIDHFKKLNDRYGHPFGDQVLKRVGEILNASVYETDFVARYGGEEFAVILPRAEPEGAFRKAEAIRRAIEAERFQIALETVTVTVSIGLAHFPRDAGLPEELVAQADAALYAAKEGGRNRAVDRRAMRS